MKNLFFKKIILMVSFVVSFSAFAEKVPFKYPEIPASGFIEELKSKEKVGVILGAGPAGLLAALLLEKNGYFVIIVENRDEFNRQNTLSTQPESIPMLKKLGIFDDFKKLAIFSQEFHFFFEQGGSQEVIKARFPGDLDSVNYSLSVSEVLNPERWSHYAIEISQLQLMLSAKVIQSDHIVLLHGRGEIVLNPLTKGHINSVNFKSSFLGYSDFTVVAPDLIIVAEGAHSTTRDQQLQIPFKPSVSDSLGGGKEYWCSGSVSLNGVRDDVPLFGHISLVINPSEGLAVWGIFRPKYNDLFLNGQAVEMHRPYLNAEDCLQKNAFLILEREKEFLKIKLPQSPQLLTVSSQTVNLFELTLSRAERFYSGENTILFGDSAGNGSPRGGLGWSLVSTVYLDALEALIKTANRQEALENYSRRVFEIVNHWHFSMKDGKE